jgi:phage terminase small subunit
MKATADVEARGFEIETTRIDKKGVAYTTTSPNPSLQIVAQCERQLLALAMRLGLTPRDRSQIKRAKPKHAAEAPPAPNSIAALYPEMYAEIISGKSAEESETDEDDS